jgi:zinc transport system substrate-binding protein
VVYTAEGLDLIEREGVTHSHGMGGEHSHAGTDPHTWSDPDLFIKQAERVAEELIRIDPEHSEAYNAALAQLIAMLEELNGAYEDLFGAMAEDVALGANHPAYDYLARHYGFAIVSFALEPAEVGSDEAIQEVEEWTAEVSRPVMFWEETPTAAVEQSLPGDIRHVFVDPLEQPVSGQAYDYTGQAYANIKRLHEALVVTD